MPDSAAAAPRLCPAWSPASLVPSGVCSVSGAAPPLLRFWADAVCDIGIHQAFVSLTWVLGLLCLLADQAGGALWHERAFQVADVPSYVPTNKVSTVWGWGGEIALARAP